MKREKMASRQDDNDPYPYQIDEKARDEKMWKLVIPARKRLDGLKTQKSALLEKHDDLKDGQRFSFILFLNNF